MYFWSFVHLQVDKSPEGQFIQLMALPRTLQQRITKLVDPPGKNRDVEEILLQVAQDPDCGAVVQQGWNIQWVEGCRTDTTYIKLMLKVRCPLALKIKVDKMWWKSLIDKVRNLNHKHTGTANICCQNMSNSNVLMDEWTNNKSCSKIHYHSSYNYVTYLIIN